MEYMCGQVNNSEIEVMLDRGRYTSLSRVKLDGDRFIGLR